MTFYYPMIEFCQAMKGATRQLANIYLPFLEVLLEN